MGKKRPFFKRNWLFDEINFLGFRLDIYTGREGMLPGFEISRPKKDTGLISNEWHVLSVALRPFSYKIIKRGNYYTHTGK